MVRCAVAFSLLAGLSIASGQAVSGQDTPSVERYEPRQVLRRPIRPIVNPMIVDIDAADIDDNELVIGVEVNGAARAYPINQLTGPQREIINDVLGGTAIAATW